MSTNLLIYVEGSDDEKFIKDFLFFLKINKFKINNIGGWNKILNENEKLVIVNEFQKNTFNGGINLIIFDADDDLNKKNVILDKIKKESNIEFETFLFPNNSESGTLETLLEKIINPKNSTIFECWNSLTSCIDAIKSNNIKLLSKPSLKSKIQVYNEVLLPSNSTNQKKALEHKRDYSNSEIWDLSSKNLEPLKNFLLENKK